MNLQMGVQAGSEVVDISIGWQTAKDTRWLGYNAPVREYMLGPLLPLEGEGWVGGGPQKAGKLSPPEPSPQSGG